MDRVEGDLAPRRRPLNKERILRAAIELADRNGLGALTMRRLGNLLGVEAMSLYKHVAGKDEILDGIVDLVVGEIELPDPGSDWKAAMRQRAASTRRVLLRHPWAIGLFEARGAFGPATLRYIDAVLASLRAGGFSLETAARSFSVLDSYVYGHVIQEIGFKVDPGGEEVETEGLLAQLQNAGFPHLAEVATLQATSAPFDYDTEFAFGLELILEALDGIRGGDH